MTAFDDAMAVAFADPHLTVAARWRPAGAGDGTALRLSRLDRDENADWRGQPLRVTARRWELPVASAPTLAGGDTLEIGEETFEVVDLARPDGAWVWTLSLRPVTP